MPKAKPTDGLDRYNGLIDLIDTARDQLFAAQRVASPTALRRARIRLQDAHGYISQALELCEPTPQKEKSCSTR